MIKRERRREREHIRRREKRENDYGMQEGVTF
jgi:hypothetical protein